MSVQEARSALYYKWTETEGFAVQMDANLLVIGFLLRPAVINRTQTSAPTTPADGDAYIVAAAGTTGVFVGQEKRFAFYSAAEAAWIFIPPKDGQLAGVTNEGTWGTQTVFKSGNWSTGTALA